MSTGLEDVLRRFSGTEPELALLLVKAPIGPVVSGLADAYGMAPLLEEAAVKPASDDVVQPSGWMAAVQLRDEPWVSAYVALGEVTGLDQELVRQMAIDLSETLSTESIALLIGSNLLDEDAETADQACPEPRTTRVSFELFSDGKPTDRARWQVGGPLEVFECELREPPEDTQAVPLELASRLATDRGIYVAACCPRSRGEQAWLALWDLDPSRVLRADLFRLRGSSFFDDETLEMTLEEVDDPAEEADSSEEPTKVLLQPEKTEPEGGSATERDAGAKPAGGLRGLLQRLIGRG